MKQHRRGVSMRIFAVVFGILALMLLSTMDFVEGCGMCTHNTITHKGARWMDDRTYPKYLDIITRHQDAFQAGAPFPDWGFAGEATGCRPYADIGEDSHWSPFYRSAAEYIRDVYLGKPWDESTEKFIAFLFGGWGHGVGDLAWHALNGQSEGIIAAVRDQELGSYDDAHSLADTGGEFLVSNEGELSWIKNQWYVPTSDILAIYERHYNGTVQVDPAVFERCNKVLFIGAQAVKLAAFLLNPWQSNQGNLFNDHYWDYFSGGVDDLGIWTAWCYGSLMGWIEVGPRYEICKIYEGAILGNEERRILRDDRHEMIDFGLKLYESGLINVKETRTARGVQFSIDTSTEKIKTLLDLKGDDELLPGPGQCLDPQAVDAYTVDLNVEDAYLGTSVVSVDVNQDGIVDIITGAPGFGYRGQPQIGAVFIIYGGKPAVGNVVSEALENADVIYQGTELYGRFGHSLAIVDLNKDGFPDLAVSAPTVGSDDLTFLGAIYVYYGTRGGFASEPSIIITGVEKSTNLGISIVGADLDGDRYADLIVGSPHAHSNGQRQTGSVSIFFTGSNQLAQKLQASGTVTLTVAEAGWTSYGETPYAWYGSKIEVIDMGELGKNVIIGAPAHRSGNSPSVGKLYFYSASSITSGSTSTFATVTGVNPIEQVGLSFAVGRPINTRDYYIAISNPAQSVGGKKDGAVVVVSWSFIRGDVLWTDLATSAYSTIHGDTSFTRLGSNVAFSDLNNDGLDDLVVAEPHRRRISGAVYIFNGGLRFPRGVVGTPNKSSTRCYADGRMKGRFGNAINFLDFDNDGKKDIVVAAHHLSTRQTMNGAFHVIYTR
eukprot:TRINITY_DN687_c0_g7_i1.p1 TRINITY_DN687_c0_g7~~TRINITY_DN687_c0_g7_i1.p1  ORF type:complete len:829 (-),score=186.68 TRINITY_DN687_c0_g7_i1:160-2646(-)